MSSRKIHKTTQELTKMRTQDTATELQLQQMQEKAQKEEKSNVIPKSMKYARASKEDKTALLDIADNEIREKLDRIGQNSRMTPEDMANKKILTRPEQAEIDAYNLRLRKLGKDANANILDEVPPELEPIPQTEQDWSDLGMEYEMQNLVSSRDRITMDIEDLHHEHDTLATPVKGSAKKKTQEREKKLELVEEKLRDKMAALNAMQIRIDQVENLRRQYINQIKQHNDEYIAQYTSTIQSLTTLGLSTARLPNESDEDYLQRMQDNVNDITTREQLFDGSLYLLREFIAKLRTLNLPLELVETVNKEIPDEVKEWLLQAWSKVSSEFVKMFGTNPFRLKAIDAINFFNKVYTESSRALKTEELHEQMRQTAQYFDDEIADKQTLSNSFKEDLKSKGYTFGPTKSGSSGVSIRDPSGKYDRRLSLKYKKLIEDEIDAELEKDAIIGDDLPADAKIEEEDEEQPNQGGTGLKPFGSKIIDHGKLLKKNVLNVKYKSKSPIFGFPVTAVSDLFVGYVNKLLAGKTVSTEQIDKLNTIEQQLFSRLLHITGLNGGYCDSNSINRMKSRLELIEGEINAGNDNAHLLTEAKEILNTFARQNVITKAEKARFYKQLTMING